MSGKESFSEDDNKFEPKDGNGEQDSQTPTPDFGERLSFEIYTNGHVDPENNFGNNLTKDFPGRNNAENN